MAFLEKVYKWIKKHNPIVSKDGSSIRKAKKETYGAPNINQLLEKQGFHISIKNVQRLMKKACIRSKTVKKFRPMPSKETMMERENILKRDFSTTSINQKWVGDITLSIGCEMAGAT